jgi:hypothetical protein
MVHFYKREPEDDIEQQLLDEGWEFAGIGLFKHPKIYNKFFTKQQATEQGMGIYCPTCGACGIVGCCSPDQCKCLYGDEYKRDYKSMETEWEKMFAFIDQLTKVDVCIDKYKMVKEAQEIIDNLGEDDEHST